MNPESVKTKLRKYAIEAKITFQEALVYYGLEGTIRRISLTNYADHFVLKGGILLYAVFDRNYGRSTTDIDLLAQKISNRKEEITTVFRKILSLKLDDGIVFDPDSVTVDTITEFKYYHGLHVSAIGYLNRTRVPVNIDIGFGDVVSPKAVTMKFPVIFDGEQPEITAYSLESVISEKLEAIVRNGFLNSRYKDFYDIYLISKSSPFSFAVLREAIVETFENRRTTMTSTSSAFGEEFATYPMHKTRWNAFLKKKKVLVTISLEEVLAEIKRFVFPLLEGTEPDSSVWNPILERWE